MSAGVVRRARAQDAAQVAGISVRTWAHAYGDFLDPRVLAGRTQESQRERWEQWLGPGTETETWVEEVGGRVAGYLTIGPSTDPDATPEVGAVLALYVDPPAQGAGLGSRLLEHAVERLRERGYAVATLWVFAENGLGRAFYERHGWAEDPDGPGNEGEGWHAPAVRYRLALR